MEAKLLEQTWEQRLSHCRYYKGEDECPYENGDIKSDYWWYESYYVRGTTDRWAYDDYMNFGGKAFPGVPPQVLGVMLHFFFKYGGYVPI